MRRRQNMQFYPRKPYQDRGFSRQDVIRPVAEDIEILGGIVHSGTALVLAKPHIQYPMPTARYHLGKLYLQGELRVTASKTSNSVRTVYIDDEAIRLLVEDRKKHPFSPYLFPSPVTGGTYGPDCVARIHKKLLARAGIEEHIRFHDLRRTFATMALQNGVDPKTVSRMLGHYSAEFTLDVYTNVTKDMQKEAAQKIGGFMAAVV